MPSSRPMPIAPMPREDFTAPMNAFAPEGSGAEHVAWSGLLGKAGPLADYLLPYYSAVSTLNALGPKLSELVRIAVATTTRCEACLAFRNPMVENEIAPNVVTLIEEFDSTPGFSARERAAIRFALALGTNHHAIDDAMWDQLKAVFNDQEVMQLSILVAHFVGMGRLAHAMRLIDSHCTLPGYRLAEIVEAKDAQEVHVAA